ncbi:MAG TPA: imidazolonepropionase [Longimicrobiales bacterium]
MALVSVTLLTGAAEVVTCVSADAASVRTAAAIAVEDGRIAEVGDASAMLAKYERAQRIACDGMVITPGFIDSHTHTVFGGYRAAEYAMRAQGVPYMEIARQGGGINASVRDIRSRSEDELAELTRDRLAQMLRTGTTTAEIKSGYGLDTASELKQLRAVRQVMHDGWDVIPTFLGAHEFPAEYREDREAYVRLLTDEMIPAVAAEGLAGFCDVFCEPGVFTPAQSRRILSAGRDHGMIPKLHADELENSGAAELAAEMDAASADHLAAISEAGVRALASSSTVATLLPTTMLFLGKTRYAPARALIDSGARVALATDFNPGSSPTSSMALVLTLACSQMGMTPLEAIVAATAGGAAALRIEDGRGTITAGAPADLIAWGVPDHREIPYHFGSTPIRLVLKRGRPAFSCL